MFEVTDIHISVHVHAQVRSSASLWEIQVRLLLDLLGLLSLLKVVEIPEYASSCRSSVNQ